MPGFAATVPYQGVSREGGMRLSIPAEWKQRSLGRDLPAQAALSGGGQQRAMHASTQSGGCGTPGKLWVERPTVSLSLELRGFPTARDFQC